MMNYGLVVQASLSQVKAIEHKNESNHPKPATASEASFSRQRVFQLHIRNSER
jgi:hypothetical protein